VTRVAYVDGVRRELAPSALLGEGGEAEVYDLGDGRAVKLWKPADHADYQGQPAAQAAAAARFDERPRRLRTLPALPAAIVAPIGFALAGARSTKVVGYVMPRVAGATLHRYGEPRWRRDQAIAGDDVVAALLALHDALAALHRAGVVVGDCNDLNVLVDGRAVHLIDLDSYQLPGAPCTVFSERFVDPRLCDGDQLIPLRPHDPDSDWFAFAAMVCRTLLWVGPWGGVHQPADPARRCPPSLRPLRGVSVFAADVVYPRAARSVATLPAALRDHLGDVFERGVRGVFPRALLATLRLRPCAACGEEHAAPRCPACQAQAARPAVVVTGGLRHTALRPDQLAHATWAVGAAATLGAPAVWLDGATLWRGARLGPERIGAVLARQTRAWIGPRLGVGFYRVGGLTVGFVFDPGRGGLDDRVTLPRLRGELVDASCVIGDDRAWLWLTCADGGRLVTTAIVLTSTGQLLASHPIDQPWLAGVAGACAAGPLLFVPTDDGIVRVEVVGGQLTQTRSFPETAPLVAAADRLALHPGGLDVQRARDAVRLHLA
jgi:hypothetical protein